MSITSLHILVDFDDVVYPWGDTAHRLCEEAGITNGNVITQWEMNVDYGCTPEAVWDVLEVGTHDGSLYASRPIDGALTQLQRLANHDHRIHIVTARGFGRTGALVEAITRDYIREWGVPFHSLTFTKDKTLGGTFRPDLAVDDGEHNYQVLDDFGVPVFLMDRPHNQTFHTHNGQAVRRVKNLTEFTDLALTIGRGTA